MIPYTVGQVCPVRLDELGDQFRRYRLRLPQAVAAMAQSLRRWGQCAPIVATVREEKPQILDGFTRWEAAGQVRGMTTLLVRLIDVDDRRAKAAIHGLNQTGRRPHELEEAWIVRALVREDGLTQPEVAELLGRHKSWVCRRLALLEKLSAEVRQDLEVGLLSPTAAREIARLPAGNQSEVVDVTRREALSGAELSGVVGSGDAKPMNDALIHEIAVRFRGGASMRRIAQSLHISRRTVKRVLDQIEHARGTDATTGPARPRPRRGSQLDAHHEAIAGLLARYPEITTQRIHEELRRLGYQGSYSLLCQRVRALRPHPVIRPVRRFETAPGEQAQMDYSTYDIDFTTEGRRRVYAFSYILGYSRRQYLHFIDSQDFPTTIRQHIRAFEHLGGVAATCLYDNMKVVVSSYDGDEPVYNPRFLAFAAHYGFRPIACRPRRAQTKGKVERPFGYVESSLLGGRSFHSLEHLNETTTWWLAEVADVHVHRQTRMRPVDRHTEERPHLLPLPVRPLDGSEVVYRTVDAEGFVVYRNNFYATPWRLIGQPVAVRTTEDELVIHDRAFVAAARHRLFPRTAAGQRSLCKDHEPPRDAPRRAEDLTARFAEFGPPGSRFLEGLLACTRYGKSQAERVLALTATYPRQDVLSALERAVRFGAFSLAAVQRILEVRSQPKTPLDALAEDHRSDRDELLEINPAPPRPTSDYQDLLREEPHNGGAIVPPWEDYPEAPEPDDPGGDSAQPA